MSHLKPTLAATALMLTLVTGVPSLAQPTSSPAPVAAGTASIMADGEVRKVDTAQGKLTLRHGPIANLDMPPMTMVFAVADKTLLQRVKPGDKVRFHAESMNGTLTIMDIVPAEAANRP